MMSQVCRGTFSCMCVCVDARVIGGMYVGGVDAECVVDVVCGCCCGPCYG